MAEEERDDGGVVDFLSQSDQRSVISGQIY